MEPRHGEDLVADTAAPAERAEEGDGPDAHPAGIRWFFKVAAVVAAFAAVPYVVPGLAELRPWVPGQALPFAGLFRWSLPTQRPEIAGGGQAEAVGSRSDDDLLAAAPLPDTGPLPVALPRPNPTGDAGPASGDAGPPAPRVDPRRFAGLTRPIEEPRGDEMSFYYERLAAVGRREPGALARAMVYSVSTNGADGVTSAMRHHLQEIFGDGGKGWVLIAPGWTYQGHRDVVWETHNWRTAVVNRGRIDDGRYGLGGVIASNMGPLSFATFGTANEGPSNRSVSAWRVFYQAWPEGGRMSLHVDGREVETVSLRADAPTDLVHDVDVASGPHRLSIRVAEGNLRLYGAVLETDGPGVVVDGLPLIGASVRSLHRFDETHIATQVRQRRPDLIVFWLGGNDALSSGFEPARFREEYGRTIARVRAGRPEASCLVVSILDKGVMDGGRVKTRPYVRPVVDAQADVARAQGCAFFDLWRATGGEGTMARWVVASPRLAVSDYAHLTEAGSRVVGTLLGRAVARGYDDYLAAGGR
jgi:lysophospholipase L1-like esterase